MKKKEKSWDKEGEELGQRRRRAGTKKEKSWDKEGEELGQRRRRAGTKNEKSRDKEGEELGQRMRRAGTKNEKSSYGGSGRYSTRQEIGADTRHRGKGRALVSKGGGDPPIESQGLQGCDGRARWRTEGRGERK